MDQGELEAPFQVVEGECELEAVELGAILECPPEAFQAGCGLEAVG